MHPRNNIGLKTKYIFIQRLKDIILLLINQAAKIVGTEIFLDTVITI